MPENYAGRMLAGTGTLFGLPSNALFNRVVDFLKAQLPQFAESILTADIRNENGLNSRLSRFIINASAEEDFFAQREIMEDETRGNSPEVDIGFYLKVYDTRIDPPLITVFEGKRLTTKLADERRREYVTGHQKRGKHICCGGIERFKFSIHGAKLNRAGMIGYLQDGTPKSWQEKISAWICDLSSQSFDPAWSEREQLTQPKTDGRVAECTSIVNRIDSELHLTHLWVDLIDRNKDNPL